MKIVIANHGLFPDVTGGMERHTFNLARHLQDLGVDVTVLVPGPDRGTAYPFPVVHLPWPGRPFWLWSNHAFSRRVGEWIDANSPDVAFGQGFNLWAYLRRRKVPCVFHPHGLEMFGDHIRPGERLRTVPFRKLVHYHGANSDRTISLGGRLTEILVQRAGIPRDRIRRIPNAVDLSQFPPSSEGKRKRSLLFVGRLAFNKGIDLLQDALKRLRGEEFRLTIVGDGPLRQVVTELAEKDSRVIYRCRLREEELIREFAAHEALLFMSRFEGMPTVILEAMASGCAVLATRIGAVETMVDRETGVVMEPDASAIAETIRMFLGVPADEKAAMGRKGREKVEMRFDWKRVAPLYLDLFRELGAHGA